MMSRPPRRLLATVLVTFTITACASVPSDGGLAEVGERVQARTGASPVWARTEAERAEVADALDTLLDSRVGMDDAVAMAFLSSPALQARLDELGIARAAFLSAALPPSPMIDISRAATGDSLEIGVAAPLLDLLFWPQRARSGEAAFETAKARAAADLADAAAQVRVAYVEHVAARQALDLYQQAESAGEAARLAAEAIYAAGNIARIDLDRQRQFAAQMTAERMRAEAEVAPSRERLIAVLGLSQEQAERLQTLTRLPAPPERAVDAELAGETALRDSLQVAAAEAGLRQIAVMRGLRNIEALLGDVDVGAEFEREDGRWSETYGLGFRLPLDLGAAGRARATAELSQAYRNVQQTRIDSLAESRAAAQRAEAARELALFHRDVSLPLSADVFDGVVRDFNAMQIGMFELLQSRRDRVDAGRDYVKSVATYWLARAELERHIRVDDLPAAQAGESAAPDHHEREQEHQHETDHPASDHQHGDHQHEGHDH
jgi:outer membrane protein, heavy metal efflux system